MNKKVILITGANGGLGLAIARSFLHFLYFTKNIFLLYTSSIRFFNLLHPIFQSITFYPYLHIPPSYQL
jgi:FlaA1/EpsC-like NDP-sugar epimerase